MNNSKLQMNYMEPTPSTSRFDDAVSSIENRRSLAYEAAQKRFKQHHEKIWGYFEIHRDQEKKSNTLVNETTDNCWHWCLLLITKWFLNMW